MTSPLDKGFPSKLGKWNSNDPVVEPELKQTNQTPNICPKTRTASSLFDALFD